MSHPLQQSLEKLHHYIETQDYRGYDPYDALKSPLFQWPFLSSNKFIRFSVQQLLKRSPVNLRPLLNVPRGYNPVTLGLCIQAYAYISTIDKTIEADCLQKIDFLLSELTRLIPEGFSGACWGYDFDWDARYFRIPAYQPTIVATGIISNALFECYHITRNKKAHELCISTVDFVLKDLQKTEEGSDICFSYSPFDRQVVFNANMKAVRCLAQAYVLSKDERLKAEATSAASFVINYQQVNGAWYYAKHKTGDWIDNYHTGYILDCLDEFIKHCQPEEERFAMSLEKGVSYYRGNFFEENQIPKFYDRETYPIDCTAAAQSILTLTRFGDTELANNVALWMIQNMQSDKGYFYFRKFKHYQIKTPFMRWSNAWMLAGLSFLLNKMN